MNHAMQFLACFITTVLIRTFLGGIHQKTMFRYVVFSILIYGSVDDDFITGSNWYKDPLKGVTVTLTNRKTGKSYEQVSKADGCYQFEDIPAGDYVLHYEKDGYKTADSYLSYSSKENTTCIPDIIRFI